MANIALWKILLTQIPSLFSFLCEFKKGEEGEPKKQSGGLVAITLALGLVLWYFVNQSINFAEETKANKKTIATLTVKIGELNIQMNREKSSKERKMDQIDLLKTRLREEEADIEKLDRKNQLLVEKIARIETKLSLCQGRTFTCDTYKPSIDLLEEIGKLTEESN